MQETFEVAHLDILDVRVVVVFVAFRPSAELYGALQRSARQAGLAGNVVAVWPDEFGRTRFLAPPEQHAFFQAVSYDQLRAQIDTTQRLPGLAAGT
jgi:hypothetical protein